MNLNKVFLLGRLTADPQLRVTPNGHQVGTFSIATNRIWNDKVTGRREETEFHNIVVWGRQADIAQKFLAKGGLVLIEGRLQTRSWDDKQGQRRKTTEIVADRIQLGPRPAGASSAGGFGGIKMQEIKPVTPEIPVINIEEPVPESEGEIKPEDLPF